ncbi:MAG TPA: hypothetical protein VGU71_06185 [Candidatus Dormibacteraeota bacterium]|nr:hypothetical protein [Candidatus Dormibacteraeota bacterium]
MKDRSPRREANAGAVLSDIVAEARRILQAAARNSTPLRLVGGLAIRMHGPDVPHPALERAYKDIDLVTSRGADREASDLLVSIGYEANHSFNTLNTGRRGLFYDRQHGRQLDLFIGTFEMCHKIPIARRLDLDSVTVPLAELLLTKLQIVHLNDKDLKDTVALLLEHEVGDDDAETVNASYIAQLCARDWGLWRTCTLNIERASLLIEAINVSAAERTLIRERLRTLGTHLEAEPKSGRWKLRARIGDRLRWYEEPEEVA